MTSLQSNFWLSRECFQDWVDVSSGTCLSFLCWKVKHVSTDQPGSGLVYSNAVLMLRFEHADGHQNNEGAGENTEQQPVKHRVTLNNGCGSEIKAQERRRPCLGLNSSEYCSWGVPFCQWQLASWVPAEKCQDGSTAARLKWQEGFNLHKNSVQRPIRRDSSTRTAGIQTWKRNWSLNQFFIHPLDWNVHFNHPVFHRCPNSTTWVWTRGKSSWPRWHCAGFRHRNRLF